MPIYEYVCDKCHAEFEELVFGNDTPACPACGVTKTRKLMSRPCRRQGRAQGYTHGDGGYDGGGGNGHSACAGCNGGNCATCH